MDVRDRIYDASVEEFDKIAAINTKGTMLCMRAVSKAMLTQESVKYQSRSGDRDLGRGCIVNLGSINSYIAGPKSLPYISSKFAVLGMTKAAGKIQCHFSVVPSPLVNENPNNSGIL